MSNHPTEKDRVIKVVENCIGGREGTIGYAILRERVVRAILKEIKRAERREREACEKVVFEYRQKMCDYIWQASKTHVPHFVADCKHDAADSIYKDIRNRRKV